jgi:hypothetical protein
LTYILHCEGSSAAGWFVPKPTTSKHLPHNWKEASDLKADLDASKFFSRCQFRDSDAPLRGAKEKRRTSFFSNSCAVNGNTDARFMRRRKTTAPVSSRPANLQSFAEVDAKHDNPHGSAPSRSGNQNRCLPIPAESGRAIR